MLLRDSEPSTPENNEITVPEAGPVAGTNFIAQGGRTLQPVETNKSLVDDFVSRLHNLLNQNKQSGFDFLEFAETLFEESQNPNAEVYRMVFSIAQKMDKSLTPSRLIESANSWMWNQRSMPYKLFRMIVRSVHKALIRWNPLESF